VASLRRLKNSGLTYLIEEAQTGLHFQNAHSQRLSGRLSRPEGAVGIIWVHIGIIVRNDGALKAGKLYIYLCVACA
jgi:hypothetical protein